jgi:hypothetical protein
MNPKAGDHDIGEIRAPSADFRVLAIYDYELYLNFQEAKKAAVS